MNIDKVVNPGKAPSYGDRVHEVYLKIEYKDGRLSISGVHGPYAGGDCHGSCGQIVDTLRKVSELSPGWTQAMVDRLASEWDTWHLNYMQAGSPAQTAELKRHTFPGYPVSHYDWAREQLRAASLQPDPNYIHEGKPYSYGSAWLRVEVPADVIAFLESLPDTVNTPAWV